MARHARVELTDPRRDQPRWFAVVAIAVAALGLGVIAAQWWLGAQPAHSTRAATQPSTDPNDPAIAAEPPSQPQPTPPSTPAPVRKVDRDAGIVSDGGIRTDVASAKTNPAAQPPPAGPMPTGVARRLTRGRVAYVRCDGLESLAGHFPCPRDRALELSVWTELRRLEFCEQARGQDGAAEVRLEFGSTPRTTVQVRPAGADSLDPELVASCVGEALEAVRTVLRPERMVISFGFSLH